MNPINIHEAKTQLSKLIEAVEAGEEVVIGRALPGGGKSRPGGNRRILDSKNLPLERQEFSCSDW